MPGGWGKRAVGRSDKKLEDDELFKEIGGQLDDANFDYSQWQRTRLKQQQSTGNFDDRLGVHTPFTVSSGAGSIRQHRVTSADGYACKHRHDKSDTLSKKERALRETELAKAAEQKAILRLRIQARQKTLDDYKIRKVQLFDENVKLRHEIESLEADSHAHVKKLLRRYEQYRGGMSTIHDRFSADLNEVQEELDEVRLRTVVEITALQKEVKDADDKLLEKQSELHTLMNYKDKEYPVKSLRIAELQKEIESLKIDHQKDEFEVQNIVESEIDKFRSVQSLQRHNIMENVTERALEAMHPSLKDMALQNMVMGKEKEFHAREMGELKEQNSALETEIKHLLKDPKTSIRQQMFPEFFPNRPKCTPDMDVVLDIPTEQWLPI